MYCRQCQYNLAGLTEPRCPECGRGYDPADQATYLQDPYRALPLLGMKATLGLTAWLRQHRLTAVTVYLLLQLGVRATGTGFVTMTLLIALVEGESGRGRTNWGNVIILDGLILLGMYLTHAVLPLLRYANVKDPVRYWSYPLGILIAALLFLSPLRP